MRAKLFLVAVIGLVFLACHIAKGRLVGPDEIDHPTNAAHRAESAAIPAAPPQRLVSLAPSITETLFALDLGRKVVGVSRFCNYPPATADIPKIGGVLNPNIEAIVALKPDLAILLQGNKAICPALQRLGIKTLTVNHKTIRGVLESIPTLGRVCGTALAAEAMAADLQTRIERIRRKTAGSQRPGVLLSVIRNLGTGRLEDVYAAGNDHYFDEMITTAGGRNLFGNQAVRYPVVAAESIIKADPQVIIDIVPSMGSSAAEAAAADWQQLGDVAAVEDGKVYCLEADYASVPGPRFILFLEKLATLLHPEVDWSEVDWSNAAESEAHEQ